jgi:hypothetical protein
LGLGQEIEPGAPGIHRFRAEKRGASPTPLPLRVGAKASTRPA